MSAFKAEGSKNVNSGPSSVEVVVLISICQRKYVFSLVLRSELIYEQNAKSLILNVNSGLLTSTIIKNLYLWPLTCLVLVYGSH